MSHHTFKSQYFDSHTNAVPHSFHSVPNTPWDKLVVPPTCALVKIARIGALLHHTSSAKKHMYKSIAHEGKSCLALMIKPNTHVSSHNTATTCEGLDDNATLAPCTNSTLL